jgi:hypothetical protein
MAELRAVQFQQLHFFIVRFGALMLVQQLATGWIIGRRIKEWADLFSTVFRQASGPIQPSIQ